MILTLKNDVEQRKIDNLLDEISKLGFTPRVITGQRKQIIGVIGEGENKYQELFESFDIVENATPITKPYKMVGREFKSEDTVVEINQSTRFCKEQFVVIAGPCSVDTKENLISCAASVKNSGAKILRGGAFKPRTSPYAFQGHGLEALRYLEEAKNTYDIPVVTEVMDVRQVQTVTEYADILQVGARNAQNFDLLREIGTNTNKPVILKRGMANTVTELLMSAEYIVSHGNPNVILCERGIRTFETATRFTLDLSAIPSIRAKSHLPIIVDPSHGVGVKEYIADLSYASAAVGANGVILEVHPNPREALSDMHQALLPSEFDVIMQTLQKIVAIFHKTL